MAPILESLGHVDLIRDVMNEYDSSYYSAADEVQANEGVEVTEEVEAGPSTSSGTKRKRKSKRD
jgi:hypothetical protein